MLKKGDRVTHPIYGVGGVCEEPRTVESSQWSGTAVYVAFDHPQTAIAGGWPYMIPVSDLTMADGSGLPTRELTEDDLRGMEDHIKCLRGAGWHATANAMKDLVAEVRRLAFCSCGRPLSQGQCNICDNDE